MSMGTKNKTLIKISCGGGLLSQLQVFLNHFYYQGLNFEGDFYLDKGEGLSRFITIYLKEPIENFYKMSNWWDSVLDQTPGGYDEIIEIANPFTPVENPFTDEGGLEKLEYFKSFVKKHINFHPKLLNLVNNWEQDLKINQNTLAVHLRLTDLNDAHSVELGICTMEDYIKVINLALEENPNINKIFVASESEPNIKTLQSSLPIPVVFVPELTRTKKVKNTHEFYKEQIEFLKQPNYSREVFLDLMLLAKCRILVGRMSAVTNTSIVLNDNLKKYYCTNQLK